jgi:hypothetical protein
MAEQPKKEWAPVSERALVLRIKRRHPWMRLVKGRTGRAMGGWLLINDRDLLVDQFIDLERLGRETGVLREYERLEG